MPFSDYKVALVTGASAGMGEAIVERLCQEGMPIKIFSFKSQKQIPRLNGAGIGTDPVHGRLPAALEQLGPAGSFYFFYRK